MKNKEVFIIMVLAVVFGYWGGRAGNNLAIGLFGLFIGYAMMELLE